MTRAVASQLSIAFEALSWNHVIDIEGNDHRITLGVNKMTGNDVLSLFGILAPNGVPVPGVTVELSAAGLVIR